MKSAYKEMLTAARILLPGGKASDLEILRKSCEVLSRITPDEVRMLCERDLDISQNVVIGTAILARHALKTFEWMEERRLEFDRKALRKLVLTGNVSPPCSAEDLVAWELSNGAMLILLQWRRPPRRS